MSYDTNLFRRAYETIELQLRTIDQFDGVIVGVPYRDLDTHNTINHVYGDFANDRGLAVELSLDRLGTGLIGEFGQWLEEVQFKGRLLCSFINPKDGVYAGSSQERFERIAANLLDAFSSHKRATTAAGNYYIIHPIDRSGVVFVGGEVFGISEFPEVQKLVHQMSFDLTVQMQAT